MVASETTMRVLLLLGLVFHKMVWDLLKRRQPRRAIVRTSQPKQLRPLKALKVAMLGGLLLQTLRLDVFPISERPRVLRRVGILLYLSGLTLAILARWQLGSNWLDVEDARVLPGQRLVSHGIYRVIRHPIYSGDLLLVTGLQLALNSWLVLGSCVLFVVVTRRAAAEEALLSTSFPEYSAYRRTSKRFVPFLF
jgi:protein-S-isoprenylcysteine O-methyltransferase Ste14